MITVAGLFAAPVLAPGTEGPADDRPTAIAQEQVARAREAFQRLSGPQARIVLAFQRYSYGRGVRAS